MAFVGGKYVNIIGYRWYVVRPAARGEYSVACPCCVSQEIVLAETMQDLIENLSLRGWLISPGVNKVTGKCECVTILACWSCVFIDKFFGGEATERVMRKDE